MATKLEQNTTSLQNLVNGLGTFDDFTSITLTITPTGEQQVFFPPAGSYYGQVIVNAPNNSLAVNMLGESAQAAPPLEDVSWEDIQFLSSVGKASDFWSVGDSKSFTLSNGKTYSAIILGFNHFDKENLNGRNNIVFGFNAPLEDKYAFSDCANWGESSLNKILNEEILGMFAKELRAAIAPSTIWSYDKETASLKPYVSKLFIPSLKEYNKNYSSIYAAEASSGKIYPLDYYIAGNGRPWTALTSGGILTRSFDSDGVDMKQVMRDGTIGDIGVEQPAHIAPMFCI